MFKIINFITLLVIAFDDAFPQQGLYYDWPNPPAPGGGRSENFWRKLWSLKGQLISKGLSTIFTRTKKRMKNFCPEDMILSWVRAPLKEVFFLFNLLF